MSATQTKIYELTFNKATYTLVADNNGYTLKASTVGHNMYPSSIASSLRIIYDDMIKNKVSSVNCKNIRTLAECIAEVSDYFNELLMPQLIEHRHQLLKDIEKKY